jgi:hypothetical protein
MIIIDNPDWILTGFPCFFHYLSDTPVAVAQEGSIPHEIVEVHGDAATLRMFESYQPLWICTVYIDGLDHRHI